MCRTYMTQLPSYVQALLDQIIKENGFVNYSLELKSGTNSDDGYFSEIKSVQVLEHGSDRKLDLVCKIAPRIDRFSKVLFSREAYFYTKVMPTFAQFQLEKGVKEENQFRSYPECFATMADDENEQYVVIMQDHRLQGFKMWNKAKPASIENMRAVVQELGKFHGLSFAMKDQRPNAFAPFKRLAGITDLFFESELVRGLFYESFDRAIEDLHKDEHKNIMRKLKEGASSYFKCCFNQEVSDRFCVVSHGDLWNNNVLYRFNDKELAEDIRILDWQTIVYSSPAFDLLRILFTSTDKALREKEYHNLLRLYHGSLSLTIKQLGSDPDQVFAFADLKEELKKCGLCAFLYAPLFLQLSLLDSNLNEKAHQEFIQRLNDVFEHIIELGYHQELISSNTN